MNRLGMMVDLSIGAEETMLAAIETSEAPVIFSHSGARAVCDHPRNVSDAILQRAAARGGIIMVDFVPPFSPTNTGIGITIWLFRSGYVTKSYSPTTASKCGGIQCLEKIAPIPKVTLADVANHIDHLRMVAGTDHVGIGSDFEGTDQFPTGLEDTSCFPALLAELLRRGYTAEEVKKIAGGNMLRVMRETEKVAQRLQKIRTPSEVRIEEVDPPVSGRKPTTGERAHLEATTNWWPGPVKTIPMWYQTNFGPQEETRANNHSPLQILPLFILRRI